LHRLFHNTFRETGLRWMWITVLVIIIDQVTKFFAMKYLTPFLPVKFLPFLNFTLVFNKGAAFSLFAHGSGWQTIVFLVIALVVSAVCVVWMWRMGRTRILLPIALSLIIGGALGNILDRVFYHHVIDFISFHVGTWYFAIFNGADSAITLGAILLIIDMIFFSKREKKNDDKSNR
jgi:signal peptidase II